MDGIGGFKKMNHAEWERKIKDVENRLEAVQKVGHLGPSVLLEVESLMDELDKLINGI